MAVQRKFVIGNAYFSPTFQKTGQAPLDDRVVVNSLSDLTAQETFRVDEKDDGDKTSYWGMVVSVLQPEPALYMLINPENVLDPDPTDINNWKRLDSTVDFNGYAIEVVKDGDYYYNNTDDPKHEYPITDSAVDEEGEYLYFQLNKDEKVYIKASKLIDTSKYYTKTEVDEKLTDISTRIIIDKSDIDASIIRLDASVITIENSIIDGVVNTVGTTTVSTKYISLSEDTSKGNVTLTLDASIVDASQDEYKNIPNNGIATIGYVQEQLSWVEQDK